MPKKTAATDPSIVIVITLMVVFFLVIMLMFSITSNNRPKEKKDIDKKTIDEKTTDEKFKKELDNMPCDNLDKVCIPKTEATINRSQTASFPIRVLNTLDRRTDFMARLTWSGKVYKEGVLCAKETCNPGKYGYKSGETTLPITPPYSTTGPKISSIITFKDIAPNYEQKHLATIAITGGDPELTYVFDVRVCFNDEDTTTWDDLGTNEDAKCKKIDAHKDLYDEPRQLFVSVR